MLKIRNLLEKNRKIIYLFAKNITLAYVLLLIINYFTPLKYFLNFNLLFILVFIVNVFASVIYFNHQNLTEKQKEKAEKEFVPSVPFKKQALSYVFLLCLGAIASIQILTHLDASWAQKMIELYNSIQNKLIIFTIIIGTSVFYLNREKFDTNLKKEKSDEKLTEQKRKKEFPQKFPKINKIPVLRNFIRWLHKEGWWYLILVLAILTLFLIIKIPYLDNSIIESPNHSKFQTYLPYLINAHEHKNIFYNQNFYYLNLNTHNGELQPYSHFPFYTWAFLPFMFLTKWISFLTLVKILMGILDALILLLAYLFFKKSFGKKIALCGLLLLAVNPFFHNLFFVTVTDRPALIFLLFSLIFYFSNKKFLAYFFGGFSVLMKESFFTITFPFLIFLILLKKEGVNKKLLNLINLSIFGFLPYIIFNFFIQATPTYYFPINVLMLSAGILFGLLIYFSLKQEKIQNDLENLIKKSFKDKTSLIILLSPIFLGVYLFFSVLCKKITILAPNFLPDLSILFQWKMYYLILRQVGNCFPETIWLFVLLGLLAAIIYKKYYVAFLPFIVSIFSYMVISSKGIFFHNYYRHIIVIFFIFLLCCFLLIMLNFSKKKYLNLIILLLIVLTFANSSYGLYYNQAEKLSKNDPTTDYTETADYLQQTVNLNEKIMGRGHVNHGLILLSFRSPAKFDIPSIREEINNFGFSKTMRKYQVRYYISIGEPDFKDILYLFERIEKSTEISRTEHILYRISDEYRKKYPDTQFTDLRREIVTTTLLVDINKILEKYKPDQYFRLKKIIGDFYIYEII